jgi:peptide/nickel transport system permease protein
MALPLLAAITRLTRSSMLEVLNADYIRTAYAKGISWPYVLLKHALRNSLIPIVTVLGLQAGVIFGGSVIIETTFNWPGLSRALMESIQRRDYPELQAVLLVIAASYILLNFLVDIAVAFINPRISYS